MCENRLVVNFALNMIPSYASFRSQPLSSDFTIAPTSVSDGIQRFIYVQFVNRAGRSLLTYIDTVESSRFDLTIGADAVLPSEDVFWIAVSLSYTGDESDAVTIAQWRTRNLDQVVRRSLPTVVSIKSQTTGRTAAVIDDLYGLQNLNEGAIAYVSGNNKFYRHSPGSVVSNGVLTSYGAIVKGVYNWIEYDGTFNALVGEIGGYGSSDIRIGNAPPNTLGVPVKTTSVNSTAIRYWLNNGLTNDGGSPVDNGRYTLDVKVNGVGGYNGVFADKINYQLQGYVNRDSAEYLSNPTQSVVKKWNPTNGFIELPSQLLRNHAAVYDIWLDFDNDEMIGKLPTKISDIQIDIIPVPDIQGSVSEIAMTIGDLIFSNKDKLKIIPDLNRMPGLASIKDGFMIDARNTQYIPDLIADTASQKVIISGSLNGYASIKPDSYVLGYSEVLRAVASTEVGESIKVQSNTITVTNETIQVTVNHPLVNGKGLVRSDYPDALIAGNNDGDFNGAEIVVYIQSSSIFYRMNPIGTTGSTNIFFISSLSGISSVPSIPSPSDPYFGLFSPTSVTIASSGSGSLTGTFTLHVCYFYSSPNYAVTKINHDAIGVIPTLNSSLADAVNNSLARVNNLSDLPDKALSRLNLNVSDKLTVDNHIANTSNPHNITLSQLNAASQSDLTALQSTVNSIQTVNTDQSNAIALLSRKHKTVTANYQIIQSDFNTLIDVDSSSNVTITLGSSTLGLSAIPGRFEFVVRKRGTGDVILATSGTNTLSASGTTLVTQYDSATLLFSNGEWIAIGNLS